jgi:hypothetical protein
MAGMACMGMVCLFRREKSETRPPSHDRQSGQWLHFLGIKSINPLLPILVEKNQIVNLFWLFRD